ncbi:MAG: hypothetical protein RI897_4104 [Verrucomicrobiota bacterium]
MAGAHGDPEDAVDAEGHGGCEGGDVAVVSDFEGDVPGLLEAVEEGADFGVEEVLGDGTEEGGDLDFVVHVDTCCATADGIDAGEVFSCELEAFVDGLEVDFGVGLVFGVPGDFGGKDGFPVFDGGEFIVTGAEVEADTAAVEVSAESDATFVGLGGVVVIAPGEFEGAVIDLFHEFGVEVSGAFAVVDLGEVLAESIGAGEGELPSADLPEEEFGEAFHDMPGGGIVG